MIDYRFQGRLTYINGGGLNVQMSAWPAAGGNWWEPTTGSYTVFGAWQAKGAASLAASYSNLANPGTNDLTEVVAPSFDTSDGWTFNASEYLDTNHYPNRASTTVIIRFSNAASGVYTMCGNGSHRLMPNRSSNVYYGSTTKSPGMTGGVLAIAGQTGYRNGTSEGAVSVGGADGPQAYDYFIGAQNEVGSASAKWIGKVQAAVIYTTILDATQISEITTNMNAL